MATVYLYSYAYATKSSLFKSNAYAYAYASNLNLSYSSNALSQLPFHSKRPLLTSSHVSINTLLLFLQPNSFIHSLTYLSFFLSRQIFTAQTLFLIIVLQRNNPIPIQIPKLRSYVLLVPLLAHVT